MGNSFGHLFRITTWGESHGGGVGVVIDGCPSGLELDVARIQEELDRRRPGQSALTTSRAESDTARILSGVFEGLTLGTPISICVDNTDARPAAYEKLKDLYRPSHADFTYEAKYGIRNWQGGGRTSARETVGRVAGGAVARQVLAHSTGVSIDAWVSQVGDIQTEIDPANVTRELVESNAVRCPDAVTAEQMAKRIDTARRDRDSVGGIVSLVARNVPAGLGEPVFDKLEARLAAAMLSLPAAKGFEIGSGFQGTTMTGSTHNDEFYNEDGQVRTRTNRSGGIQGGISNGEDITLRVAFKPTATIGREQETVDRDGNPKKLAATGRHDPCVLPRAVPIVEAMAALVIADAFLLQRARHPDRLR